MRVRKASRRAWASLIPSAREAALVALRSWWRFQVANSVKAVVGEGVLLPGLRALTARAASALLGNELSRFGK
jgi:hypothetical protein